MPRYQPRPDPDTVYVCSTSGVFLRDGREIVLRAGERVRGDDPRIQEFAECFVADGEPVPNVFAAVVARHDAEQPQIECDVRLPLEPVALEAEDVRTLARDVTVAVGPGNVKTLVTYSAGTVFRDGCALVEALPDAFDASPSKQSRWR